MHQVKTSISVVKLLFGVSIVLTAIVLYVMLTIHLSPAWDRTRLGRNNFSLESLEDLLCPMKAVYEQEYFSSYETRKRDMTERLSRLKKRWDDGQMKLYVQHIHKGGGTSLCGYFKASKLRMFSINNCNGPAWFRSITASNFYMLKKAMDEYQVTGTTRASTGGEPLQVAFNERSMASFEGTEASKARGEFVMLTTVRNPVQRIVSHMAQVYRHQLTNASSIDELATLLKSFVRGIKRGKLADWEEFRNYESNFQSMVLLGRFHNQTSKIPITADNALHRLDEFDIVIPTDELAAGFTWLNSYFQIEGRIEHARSNSISDALFEAMKDGRYRQLLQQLVAENCDDAALYHRAKIKFQMLQEVLTNIL